MRLLANGLKGEWQAGTGRFPGTADLKAAETYESFRPPFFFRFRHVGRKSPFLPKAAAIHE